MENLGKIVGGLDKIKLGIPGQFAGLNSFQLQVQYLDSNSLNEDEKNKRQEIINNLNRLEQFKIITEKSRVLQHLDIFKELFIKNKEELEKKFSEFIENSDEPFINGMTDLEYFYLNTLLKGKFKEETEYSKKEKELMTKMWELCFYRFALKFLRGQKEEALKRDDYKKIKVLELKI